MPPFGIGVIPNEGKSGFKIWQVVKMATYQKSVPANGKVLIRNIIK